MNKINTSLYALSIFIIFHPSTTARVEVTRDQRVLCIVTYSSTRVHLIHEFGISVKWFTKLTVSIHFNTAVVGSVRKMISRWFVLHPSSVVILTKVVLMIYMRNTI